MSSELISGDQDALQPVETLGESYTFCNEAGNCRYHKLSVLQSVKQPCMVFKAPAWVPKPYTLVLRGTTKHHLLFLIAGIGTTDSHSMPLQLHHDCQMLSC